MNFKEYKEKYEEIKQTLKVITDGSIPDEVIAKFGGANKDEVVERIEAMLEFFQSSIYFFHNSDGTVNRKAFLKYYDKFKNATEEEKLLYEFANRVPISALSEYLNNVYKIIQEEGLDGTDDSKIFDELGKLLATRKH